MEKRVIFKSIFVIVVVVLLISIFIPINLQKDRLETQIKEQKQTIERLAEKNKVLEEEIRLLTEDPDYIEEVARRELGLAKEGEIIYRNSLK